MELLDEIKNEIDGKKISEIESMDPYVDDLEKVDFVINGRKRTLVGGSFAKLPFFVAEHEFDGGRRLLVMNLPDSDQNVVMDNGRKTRGVRFNAYLIGRDVFSQKMKMIDAMETAGIRELVHPYLGRTPARGWNIRVSEKSTEKQFVKLELTFVITQNDIVNKMDKNSIALIEDAFDTSIANQKSAFEKAWNISNSIVDAMDDAVNDALDAVNTARESVREAALFKEKLRKVRENIRHLIMSPGDMFNAVKDLISFEDDIDDDGNNQSSSTTFQYQNESFSLSKWEPKEYFTFNQSTSDKMIESNMLALKSMISGISSTFSASKVVSTSYDSVSEAKTVISKIIESIDYAQTDNSDAETYYSLSEIRALATSYVSGITNTLSIIKNVELNYDAPIFTLAWALFGTIDGYDDILSRNEIKDPLYVPNNTSLEIKV